MRTVLWDMDGTISDSEQAHFHAWQISLEPYGVTYSFDDFIADFGRSNSQLLPELLDVPPGSDLVDKVDREKEANFRRLARQEKVKPLLGVMEWLECFRAKGVPQVVSSSGPMANIVASVDILDIGDYFLALISGATLPRSKPDPAIFLNSAYAVRAQPHECIVVEDSMHGVEGALRAGMACIAVGKVAASKDLCELLRSAHEPTCLAVETLNDLTWAGCEELWRQAEKR